MSATMDDRDGFIWVDGKLAPVSSVPLSPVTRSRVSAQDSSAFSDADPARPMADASRSAGTPGVPGAWTWTQACEASAPTSAGPSSPLPCVNR